MGGGVLTDVFQKAVVVAMIESELNNHQFRVFPLEIKNSSFSVTAAIGLVQRIIFLPR